MHFGTLRKTTGILESFAKKGLGLKVEERCYVDMLCSNMKEQHRLSILKKHSILIAFINELVLSRTLEHLDLQHSQESKDDTLSNMHVILDYTKSI